MKKNKKALSDILLRWSASYVLISVLAIIMFLFCIQKYTKALQSEVEYSNSILVESMQMQIDEAIGELRIFSSKATLNRTVIKLRQRTSYDDVSRYELYELVQELGNNMVSSDSQRSFLYFPQMDFLLSGRYYNTSRDFFEIAMKDYGFPYAQWYDIISQTYKEQQIFQLKCLDGSYLTVLVRPVDSRTRQGYPVNAIIMLDFGQVIKQSDMFVRSENQICIVDQKNAKVISKYEIPAELKTFLLEQTMDKDYDNLFMQTGASRAVVSYIKSKFEGWKYVVVTPQQAYVQKTADLQRLVTISCLLYLIISVVVVAVSLKRHYQPIRNMVDVLHQQGGDMEGGNTYEYLSKSITSLMSKNKENDSKLHSQYEAIRKELLRRLITAEKEYDMPDPKMLEQYDIRLEEGSYLLLAYRLESVEEPMPEGVEGAGKDELAWFILDNVTKENLKDIGLTVSSVMVKNQLVMIVQSDEEEGFLEKVKKGVQITSEFIGKCFNFHYRTALSETYTGGGIFVSKAFRQAKRVFEYQKTTVYESVSSYRDINILPTDTMLKYPLEVENRLFNAVMTGESAKACEIIDGVLKDNIHNCLTPEAMQFLVSNIASTVIRAVNRITKGKGAGIQQSQIMELWAGNDLKEVQAELERIVEVACSSVKELVHEERSSQKFSLNEAVKDYVENNYADSGMSVNEIAQRYEVQPATLSKIFKEAEGENLSQYINRVRLTHAKELLLQNVKLGEVALRCGYGSQRTFLRIFKQYEGATPSQYRELEEKKGKEE